MDWFRHWWLRLLILLVAGAPYLLWELTPAHPLTVTVIDKTVPTTDYREHQGLFWLLDHWKISRPMGGLYDKAADYFGYRPGSGGGDEPVVLTASDTGYPDLIYVADTYGVYSGDLVRDNVRADRSRLIYGGLTLAEWNRLWDAKGLQTTLVMEFNSFGDPTDDRVRAQVESDMGIAWTGWVGRYFADLAADEVPGWLRTDWEKESDRTWAFRGPGFALVDQHDRVLVLDGSDVLGPVAFQATAAGAAHYAPLGQQQFAYPYWFDVLAAPGPETAVEAEYHLPVSGAGAAKLSAAGIPAVFPAVIRNAAERAYYFAGDYADRKVWPPVRIFGLERALSAVATGPEDLFYWRVYAPIMRTILREIPR
jgi:hypothetical protein